MDNIIKLYYENCQNDDEFEIIFNSNTYEKNHKHKNIHKSGLFFESSNFLKKHINEQNVKNTATSYNDFNRLISVLKNKFKGNIILHEEYLLSIGLQHNQRIRLKGIDTIKNYCNSKNGELPKDIHEDSIEYIKKEKRNLPNKTRYFNDEYNFRINYKTEKNLSQLNIETLNKNFKDSLKTFRYIKRYTLINTLYPYLKIDCSIVKSKNNKFKTLKESNIFKSNPDYEIEIELINDFIMDMKKKGENIDYMAIKRLVKLIFSTLQNTSYPIDITTKNRVLNNYHTLARINIKKSFDRKGCLNNNKNFFGPGSIALQREDFHENSKNHILKNYCVTDKADGERKFIFITEDSKYNVYLIDMNLEIQFTGLTVTNKTLYNTIIDGEHILSEKADLNLFMAFDIYYLNKKIISKFKFYKQTKPRDPETRYNCLIDTINKINDEGGLEMIDSENDLKIKYKKFYFTNGKEKDIFQCCRDMFEYINSNKLGYHTDGLIFTPIHLKLKQEYKEERYDMEDIRKRSRWNACYKWKESHENTIDFLIKVKEKKQHKNYRSSGDSISNTKENIIELYVGDYIMNYKLAFWTNDPNIKKTYDKVLFNPSTYNDNGLASYTTIKEQHGNSGIGMYTENGEEYIEDDTIVEFRYDNSDGVNSEKNKWIPIRVRHNKTLQYKNERSNFGNNIKTAISNWRSINEPVTKEVLRGTITISDLEKEHLEESLSEGKKNKKPNAYWNPSIIGKRNKSVLKNTKTLRIFHNQIKYYLLKYCSDNLNKKKNNLCLLDMTCGKGGDLMKWVNNGYKYIVGFDKYQDSITNNEDGIYKRAYAQKNNKKFKGEFPNMIFEQADAGKNYLKGEAFIGETMEKDNIGHNIIKCITGRQYDSGLEKVLSKFEGKAKDGFDVISNQFSIHYFFENMETLTGFLQNVSECCKHGGYFIGTCFDGKTLYKKLEKKSHIITKKNGHKIFEINRVYDLDLDRYNTFLNDDSSSLGYPIDVYMESIGVKTREYLVNFDYFTTIMRHYGFTLENVKSKKVFKNGTNMFDTLKKITVKTSNIYEKLKPLEKEISFNNRYFIFRKTIRNQNDTLNITRQLRENRIMGDDLLEMVDGGYNISDFSKGNRKKDNNFNGLPQVFKTKNADNYNFKLQQILKTKDIRILKLTQDYIQNNFESIINIYNDIKINTFLVLDFGGVQPNTDLLDSIENKLLEQDDIIYYGIISKLIKKNYIPYLIFKKGNKINFKPEEINEFNKEISINKSEELYAKARLNDEKFAEEYEFSVFNDCPLIGGTKQRALVPFISRIVEDNIIYAGPSIGFAQLALAKSLSILYNNDLNNKKKLILYFNGSYLKEEHFKITKNLVEIYDNIEINIFCDPNYVSRLNNILMHNLKSSDKFNIKLKNMNLNKIQDYVVAKYNKKNHYIVPFGLRFPGFVNQLSKQIIKAMPGGFDKDSEDMRIWLVAGSGAILNSLYKVFPNADFVIVEVGHTIYPDVMETDRTDKYIYSVEMKKKYRTGGNLFNEEALDIYDMPYDSVINYDAKVWPIFKKYYNTFKKKDNKKNFIWNVACLKTFEDILKKDTNEDVGESKKDTTFKAHCTEKTIKFP